MSNPLPENFFTVNFEEMLTKEFVSCKITTVIVLAVDDRTKVATLGSCNFSSMK